MTITCRLVVCACVGILVLAVSPTLALPDPNDSVAVALRTGRYQMARRLLHARTDTVDSATHCIRLGIVHLRLGQPRIADSLFMSAPVQDFQVPYCAYWRACAWQEGRDLVRAAEVFDRLSENAPTSVRDSSQVWALRCGLMLGDTALVKRALGRLLARSDDLAAVGLLAQMRYDSSDRRSAWLTLLDRYPGTPQAYEGAFLADSFGWRASGRELLNLARVYRRQEDYPAAINTWYLALEDSVLAPQRVEIRYRLAELLVRQRQYREAEQHLVKLLDDSTAQDYWPASMRLYALLERRRDREERTRYWERRFAESYPSHPEVPDALWNIGMSWDRVRDCEEAVKVYEELARRFPSHPLAEEGGWRIGFCAYRAGHYGDAHRVFSRLARSAKDYVIVDQAGYWSALSLYAQGRLRDARDEWDRWAAYSPRSYYAVASAVAAGRPIVPPEDERPVEAAFVRSVSSWPGFIEAQWLSSLGETQWARTVLTEATSGMATSIEEMEALADAFEAVADYPTALRWRWRAMWKRTTEDRYHELPPDLLRRVWPDFFRREVVAAARESDVDPALVWAIIRQESVFGPDVTSQADARGLMQIIPSTGRALAREVGIEDLSPEDLYDPGLNIRLGTRYAAQLLRRFKKIDLVAAAYNAGPSNALRWERAAGTDHDVLRETITYSETRRYVKLILRNYLIYRSLYRVRREEGM